MSKVQNYQSRNNASQENFEKNYKLILPLLIFAFATLLVLSVFIDNFGTYIGGISFYGSSKSRLVAAVF